MPRIIPSAPSSFKSDATEVKRLIPFFSEKLSQVNQSYYTFERKYNAVLYALEHFRIYLLARPFRLKSDHRALQFLRSKKPTISARIAGLFDTLYADRVPNADQVRA